MGSRMRKTLVKWHKLGVSYGVQVPSSAVKTSSENLRSFFVRYYRENALSFIIGKKKKQKWQYNENALRICKKRTANLENVKKAKEKFREKCFKNQHSRRVLL